MSTTEKLTRLAIWTARYERDRAAEIRRRALEIDRQIWIAHYAAVNARRNTGPLAAKGGK